MSELTRPAHDLLDIVLARSARDAAAFVLAQLDAGRPPTALVTDLLAPVQVEIGERWQRNTMSAADEHAATAVIDNGLAALAVTAAAPQVAYQGTIAVVCARGDWHTLPARMAAEMWRWDGWEVTFLGGSLPPGDLGSWLRSARPDALAVTCSVSMYLPGVLALADAAAAAGVPCVAGGRGINLRNAQALGLRWAGETGGLGVALNGPPPRVDRRTLDERHREVDRLESIVEDLVADAIRHLRATVPDELGYSPEKLERTREDYRYIARFLGAAVLCDDPSVFTEFLDWLQAVLAHRGLPPTLLPAGLAAFAEVLPTDFERAHEMCAATASRSWQPAAMSPASGPGVPRRHG